MISQNMEKLQVKKRIQFNFGGEKLVFDVSQSLFSSYTVDEGTRILLNSLRKNPKISYKKILDVGCGYGVIGIFLKKKNPLAEVECIDRDVLAVQFTKHNSELNNSAVIVYPSLDYERVKNKFSLIACNFPAKSGTNVMKKIFWDASKFLDKEGIFSVVLVKELKEEFENVLRSEIEIVYQEEKAEYFVVHIRYNKKIFFDEEPYLRNEMTYSLDDKEYKIKTVRNVPEFDKISFQTKLINELLKEENGKQIVGIINPFQGHRAISAEYFLKPKKIDLISRDLLQLRATKDNLEINGFSNYFLHEEILPKTSGDLLIWNFDKEEEINFIIEKINLFKKNYGKIIICEDKNIIEKIIKLAEIKIIEKKEKEKFLAILFE